MGREPDFLDGHQHVHALPTIREGLLLALERLGLERAVYVRDPADRPAAIAARRVSAPKAFCIALLARGFGPTLRGRGIATNSGFSGIGAFDARRDYARDFAGFLRAPGSRHLVMCHPGFVDAELEAADGVSATRPREHGFLAGDEFTATLSRAGAAMVRFRDLS
jgi:predicted glycoside hydrolase/deacetylase ChbG (UPF0249 family)